MPERVMPGPVQENACIREAVCVHTKKIYDSCKDKDCIEDLRLYPTQSSQCAIDRALSVRAKKAELLCISVDVESAGFNRGFYTVDVRYFYRITADAFMGAARPVEIRGLSVFDKRAILFGSESSAKIFTSDGPSDCFNDTIEKSNMPTAVVESVDPIVLGIKLVDVCDPVGCDCDLTEIPPSICACFDCDLVFGGGSKRVYVTLGQFTIIRLERDTQLLIPAYDYCMPEKDCTCGHDEDPCEIFRHVKFPVNEFFPPNSAACDDSEKKEKEKKDE
ncbi:MAG: hypothetical protein PHT34_04495 [Oscillospiraceae bacterium]|nr:hypothetical protein [Oscillospiraceae bacterium]